LNQTLGKIRRTASIRIAAAPRPWFGTTTTSGGKLVGFGNANTGTSTNYDRHIYMEPDGRITFGVYRDGFFTASSSGALNDGQWHQAVGTMGPSGLTLYVDGRRVGTNGGTSTAQPYSGYWRIGGDSPWSGNAYFAGDGLVSMNSA